MAKLLKLTGVKSFTCPAFGAELVKHKQVIRVDDDIAAKLEKGERPGNGDEAEPIPYWTDPLQSDTKVDYDFTTTAKTPTPAADEAGEAPIKRATTQRRR